MHYDSLFIGGKWTTPAGSDRISVVSPATEETVGSVPAVTNADVDAAVAAARDAFDSGPWPSTPPLERAEVLGIELRDPGVGDKSPTRADHLGDDEVDLPPESPSLPGRGHARRSRRCPGSAL